MNQPPRLDGATLKSAGESAVVTPHVLASEAGTTILQQGGNATDAAIAANAVLGVVAPETCGIGGDLFALVHAPGESVPATLNSSGRAGSGAIAERVRASGEATIAVDSPYAVTVPGCVDGWLAINQRFGRLSLAAVLAPAISHAANGFAATPELAGSLQRFGDVLAPQLAARGLYPNGNAPLAGEVVTRPGLKATLDDIAKHGRDAFYSGHVADSVVAATNGVIQLEDMTKLQADWIDPVGVDVLGSTGWTIPPNSQGYLTLAAAHVFEQLDPPRDPDDPSFTHAAIEAFRSVAWERDDLVADAQFAPMTGTDLLDPRRLADRTRQISLSARTEWPQPRPAAGGTAYLCVRDSDGMGVSLIQSNYHGIGSRIGAGAAGFFLHDRGSNFTLEAGHPNELAPGKRPLHTLSPTIWTKGGRLDMILGTRGGDFQPQTLLQMLTYMRWAGLAADEAQRMPRWTTGEWPDGDASVVVEPHLAADIRSSLSSRGHEVSLADRWMGGWGPVSVITGDADRVTGAADPRVASTAARSG